MYLLKSYIKYIKKSLNNIIIIFFYIQNFLFICHTIFAFLSNIYSHKYIKIKKIKQIYYQFNVKREKIIIFIKIEKII